jgi:hypothetical protein
LSALGDDAHVPIAMGEWVIGIPMVLAISWGFHFLFERPFVWRTLNDAPLVAQMDSAVDF